MARSTKKSGINKNFLIVSFCVVTGIAVTACQPQLMREEERPVVPQDEIMTSPMPTGVPVTEDAMGGDLN